MKQKETRVFDGYIDTDSDIKRVRNGDYIHALNVSKNIESTNGLIAPIQGNTEITYTQPAGNSTCIGTVNDPRTGKVVMFMYNDAGNHHLVLYDPKDNGVDPDGTVEVIMTSSVWDFTNTRHIHSAKFIDSRLVYWPDGIDVDGAISGNPPRKINIEKATLSGKTLTYELVFGDTSFDVGSAYEVGVTDLDGAVITATNTFYTVPAGPPAKDAVITAIIAALALQSVTATVAYNAPTDGATRLLIEHVDAERIITIGGVGLHNLHFTPLNHYPQTLSADYLTVIKPVPPCPPVPRYVVDSNITEVGVANSHFQFRYRYVFDDGEKSAWGSASYIPTNLVYVNGGTGNEVVPSELYSKIIIALNDEFIDDQDWKCFIRGIDLAVRYTEDGIWRLVGNYPVYDLGVETHEIEFLNNGRYSAVPSDDAGTPDIQALKNYDFAPRVSLTAESINDAEGRYIMTWGGNLEAYDIPEVFADIEVFASSPGPPPYPSDQYQEFKTLKSGGVYEAVVVYEDLYGRQGVARIGRVNIPFSQNAIGRYWLRITFNTDPPSWAVRYRIGLSKNLNQVTYIQAPAWELNYWILDLVADTGVTTTYVAGDATHIGFTFDANQLSNSSRNYIFEQVNDQQRLSIPQYGDRIQVVGLNGSALVAIDIPKYNWPVAGYNLTEVVPGSSSVDRFTVFIAFDAGQPDFGALGGPADFILFEIYTPGKQIDETLFYEFGDCYPVVGGLHDTNPVDLEEYGDTWIFAKEYIDNYIGTTPAVWVPRMHFPSMYTFSDISATDHGRPVVFDSDDKEQYRFQDIRATDTYVPDTSVNGLSSFRGVNRIQINKDFGSINKLARTEGILLAIGSVKTQSLYIGSNSVIDLSGNTLIGKTSNILNLANEFQKTLGTLNPESVVVYNGRCYAIDVHAGTAWRYSSGGGQVEINYGTARFFNTLAASAYLNRVTGDKIIGGFDPKYDKYYVTINVSDYGTETWGFEELPPGQQGRGGWVSEYSFIPEAYAMTGTRLLSMLNGKIWKHESGDYCTFYDTAYGCTVTVPFNADPISMKLFWNITQQSKSLWECTLAEIPPTASYPAGMSSEIIAAKWGLYEGQYKADFLRDYNDPSLAFAAIVPPLLKKTTALLQGRPLRGEAIKITMSLQNPEINSNLHSITITTTT